LDTTHELRSKFAELEAKWDEKPRLDMWLHKYCQVEDNAYTQAVASKPFIAAVRRVANALDADRRPVRQGEARQQRQPIVRHPEDQHRDHGTLEGAFAAGLFSAEAEVLLSYRRIATFDSSAPLPELADNELVHKLYMGL
jgi:hypothetical protein